MIEEYEMSFSTGAYASLQELANIVAICRSHFALMTTNAGARLVKWDDEGAAMPRLLPPPDRGTGDLTADLEYAQRVAGIANGCRDKLGTEIIPTVFLTDDGLYVSFVVAKTLDGDALAFLSAPGHRTEVEAAAKSFIGIVMRTEECTMSIARFLRTGTRDNAVQVTMDWCLVGHLMMTKCAIPIAKARLNSGEDEMRVLLTMIDIDHGVARCQLIDSESLVPNGEREVEAVVALDEVIALDLLVRP